MNKIIIQSPEGDVTLYVSSPPDEKSHACIITCGGAGGGLDGPYNLYDDMAAKFPIIYNLTVVQLDYRVYNSLKDAINDLVHCINYVTKMNYGSIIVIGWSMGGANVIESSYRCKDTSPIKGIITIAGQIFGAGNLPNLAGIPILILHGTNDDCLKLTSAEFLYKIAKEPKKKIEVENGDHGLSGKGYDIIVDWLKDQKFVCT